MDSDKQLSERPRRVLFMSDHFGHSGGRVHGGTTYFVDTLPALKRAGIQLMRRLALRLLLDPLPILRPTWDRLVVDSMAVRD